VAGGGVKARGHARPPTHDQFSRTCCPRSDGGVGSRAEQMLVDKGQTVHTVADADESTDAD